MALKSDSGYPVPDPRAPGLPAGFPVNGPEPTQPAWIRPGSDIPSLDVRDPWAHRSAGMRCQTCMYFAEKERHSETKVIFGRCRRHAPTLGGWPAVFGTDWCGDHKLDENKI